MKVMVRMLAFCDPANGDPAFRIVEVSDNEWNSANNQERLDLVYKYGQNDFQPQECPSVSIADVILLPATAGETPVLVPYIVAMVGFKVLTNEQFIQLENTERYRRSFCDLVRS